MREEVKATSAEEDVVEDWNEEEEEELYTIVEKESGEYAAMVDNLRTVMLSSEEGTGPHETGEGMCTHISIWESREIDARGYQLNAAAVAAAFT